MGVKRVASIIIIIRVLKNCSTLHTVYYIQQSATQGSNDTAHTLSCKTTATTSFSPESKSCQKQTAPRFCQQSDQVGRYLASIHQMAPPKRGRTRLVPVIVTTRMLVLQQRHAHFDGVTCRLTSTCYFHFCCY